MTFNVVTTFNNFARGQIDADLNGRFDLPIYTSGAEAFQNFESVFEGNAVFRNGFENLLAFEDCAFIEFKFSQNQNYVLVLYNTKMRFLSYDGSGAFGWVLDGALNILEIDTPWSLAESKTIALEQSYSQNFDGMILCHDDHEPQQLTRLAANDFELRGYSRKKDPFATQYGAGKTITGVTQATTAVISIASHGWSVGDRVLVNSVGGMTEINEWVLYVLEVVSANEIRVDLDTTEFTAYTSGGSAALVTAGDFPKRVMHYKGRLYYGNTPAKPTDVFGSEAGDTKNHLAPTSIEPDSAFQFTIQEFTSEIDWFYPGQNSLIAGASNAVVAINGGSVDAAITAETFEANRTTADAASTVQPFSKDGYIFYAINDGRNLMYFSYDLLSETFKAKDANVLSYYITKSTIKKMRHVKTKDDLIYIIKNDGKLVSCTFNEDEKIIGWHIHPRPGATIQDIAQISNNEGVQQLFALTVIDGEYYIERKSQRVEFSRRVDFYTGNKSADNEAHYRLTMEELKNSVHLDNFSTYSDLRSTTITYDAGAGTVTDAGSGFVSGDVGKHIVYKTATGYESGRFEITAYNSSSSVDVDVLQEPTSNSYSSWYLTFDTLSGLDRFDGVEVAVVVDGGFLDNMTVSSGELDLGVQATHAAVGYAYRGYIQSFTLGFAAQGRNTQMMVKNITRAGIRFYDTVGGKFGADPYLLEEIQDQKDGDLNYLPPPLINGTRYVDFSGDFEVDAKFVLVQDIPGPMAVTAVMVEGSYAA